MLIRRPPDIAFSEITPERSYLDRRAFIAAAGAAAAALALPTAVRAAAKQGRDDRLTPLEDVTTYNNYYEFGTGKDDPARNATAFRPRPWTVEVAGECARAVMLARENSRRP